uniref:Ovule protein n=1 Tax=Globodera pallida TaxID=36090 RepID=A0A183C6Z9_GLOPA
MIEIGNRASNLDKFLNQNKFKENQYETEANPDRQQTTAQFCCLRLRQRYKTLNKMPFRQHSLLCRSSSSSTAAMKNKAVQHMEVHNQRKREEYKMC